MHFPSRGYKWLSNSLSRNCLVRKVPFKRYREDVALVDMGWRALDCHKSYSSFPGSEAREGKRGYSFWSLLTSWNLLFLYTVVRFMTYFYTRWFKTGKIENSEWIQENKRVLSSFWWNRVSLKENNIFLRGNYIFLFEKSTNWGIELFESGFHNFLKVEDILLRKTHFLKLVFAT